jgi:hypothetical protein
MAPNMTEFLANLNAPQDFNESEDLSLFTTTDFLNLDFGDASAAADVNSSSRSGSKDSASPDQWLSPSTFISSKPLLGLCPLQPVYTLLSTRCIPCVF